MEAEIVNPQPKYQRVALIEPASAGYLHITALVEPTLGRTPIPRRTAHKAALLSELKTPAARLERHEAAAETGLNNSTLLGPLSTADYVFVNHARWDLPLPVLAAKMLGKPSFYSYVLANLHANDTAAMPILYRLA
jgi:hypothetical protein